MHDPCIHAAYAHARPCRVRGGAHVARDATAERHPRYVVARGVPARLEPHSSPLGLALVHMHTRVHAHPGVRASRASRQACSHLGRRRGGERAARRTRSRCGTHGGGVAMPWGARSLRGCGARAPRRRQSSAGQCCTARRSGVPPCLNHACASFAPSAPLSNPRHPLAPSSSPLTPSMPLQVALARRCATHGHALLPRAAAARRLQRRAPRALRLVRRGGPPMRPPRARAARGGAPAAGAPRVRSWLLGGVHRGGRDGATRPCARRARRDAAGRGELARTRRRAPRILQDHGRGGTARADVRAYGCGYGCGYAWP